MNATETLIPLVGMLMTIVLPIGLVAIILFYKHRRQAMIHETILRLAERGVPVPQELLLPPRSPNAGLRGGLVLVALGVALAFFLRDVGSPWSIGLIPGLMGVALLVAWAIERRSGNPPPAPPR